MILEQNDVRIAVARAGGATKTSNLLGVSNACVYRWMKVRYVPDIDNARKLSEASGVAVEKLRPVL